MNAHCDECAEPVDGYGFVLALSTFEDSRLAAHDVDLILSDDVHRTYCWRHCCAGARMFTELGLRPHDCNSGPLRSMVCGCGHEAKSPIIQALVVATATNTPFFMPTALQWATHVCPRCALRLARQLTAMPERASP